MAASLTLGSVSVDPSTGVATLTVNTDTISGTMFLRIYETDPGVVAYTDVIAAPTDSTAVTASPVVFTVPNNGWDDTDYYAVVQRTSQNPYQASTTTIQAGSSVSQVYTGADPYNGDMAFEVRTTTASEIFEIYAIPNSTFDATIDWGDGGPPSSITAFDDVDLVHTYAVADDYTVRIAGDFPRIYFYGIYGSTYYEEQRAKVRAIYSLGSQSVTKLRRAFKDLINVQSFNIGPFDATGVTDMEQAFEGFDNCSLIQGDMSNFVTATTTTINYAFSGWLAMTSPLGTSGWDTSNVLTAIGLFSLWTNCTSPPDVSGWDTGSMTNMAEMFNRWETCTIPPDVSNWDTSSVTDVNTMFAQWIATSSSPMDIDIDQWSIGTIGNYVNFLNGSTLTTTCYDRVCVAWGQNQTINNTTDVHMGNSTYSNATARAALALQITNNGYSLIDGGPA